MWTTVELNDFQRAELLRLAARRGEKGVSRLVQEAIDLYLESQHERQSRVEAAVRVLGSFDEASSDLLAQSVKALRATWR